MENIAELKINERNYKKTDISKINMPSKQGPYWEIVYKNGMIIWATGNVTIITAGR